MFGGRRRYAGCAPSSHLYFWDPSGPPAPTTHCNAYIPEVRCCDGEVSGCTHENVLFDTWHSLILMLISLLLRCFYLMPFWLHLVSHLCCDSFMPRAVCSDYMLFHFLFWFFHCIQCRISQVEDACLTYFIHPKQMRCRARKIGNRRFRSHRRVRASCRTESVKQKLKLWMFVLTIPITIWYTQLGWAISNISRNRMMHMKHGNGGSTKGKGKQTTGKKGKGKVMDTSDVQPAESIAEDVATRVGRVLPEAALRRMQSGLVQREWSCNICYVIGNC